MPVLYATIKVLLTSVLVVAASETATQRPLWRPHRLDFPA